MATLAIVEDLEILGQVGARRGARGPGGVVDELDLQRGEEALGDGVVPAIAPAAHAADDAVVRQDLLVIAAGVLDTPTALSRDLGCPPDWGRFSVIYTTRGSSYLEGRCFVGRSLEVR